MIGVIVAVFATLFIVGDLLARVLTAAWTAWISPAVISVVTAIFGDGTVGRVVLWGVDGGILATLAVGIPYILTFYFILALVEDTGYMNAAAFLSDRIMHRVGLHGRAIIPLIAAGGCNVPAIIATRSLGSKRERTIAAVLATLTPCSARTAVIIGAVAGVAGWQYALLTYVVIIVVVVLAGLGMNRLMPGDKGVLVMEMFPFRRPVLRQVVAQDVAALPRVRLGRRPHHPARQHGAGRCSTRPAGCGSWARCSSPSSRAGSLLPMVAGLTLVFAVLRKELALQLLLVFAAVQAGGAVVEHLVLHDDVADRHLRARERDLHPLRGHDRRARARAGLAAHGRHLRRHHRRSRSSSAASSRACCRSSPERRARRRA